MKPQNPVADQSEERISKSQRKRESKDVQALGAELTGLPREQLESLPLPEHLLQAIADARAMNRHGARKRQIKYIGGLLRAMDVEPIRAALEDIHGQSARAAAQHHRIERWRDRLLAQGDEAVTALLNEYPSVDRQRIRQLIRAAHREAAAGKPPQAARSLFRALRALLK
jgi:ribosome-associated protein